jgi:hypothetical protein
MKSLGPIRQLPSPNHRAARADRVQTVATALSAHGFATHWFFHPWPPPRAAIRWGPHRRAPPFRPSSYAHAPPLLLLTSRERRPPHPCPLSVASSSHPSTRSSPPRAPPRAGAPLWPFQVRHQQPLRPLTAAPPRSMRTAMDSLVDEPLTSPTPPI